MGLCEHLVPVWRCSGLKAAPGREGPWGRTSAFLRAEEPASLYRVVSQELEKLMKLLELKNQKVGKKKNKFNLPPTQEII